MDPMNVLAPNTMSDLGLNRGVDDLVANHGLGINELMRSVNPQAAGDRREGANPEIYRNRLRVARARQFGMNKEDVGF